MIGQHRLLWFILFSMGIHAVILQGIRWNPSYEDKKDEVLTIDLNRIDMDPFSKSLEITTFLPPLPPRREMRRPYMPPVASKVLLPSRPIEKGRCPKYTPLFHEGLKHHLLTQLFSAPSPMSVKVPNAGRLSSAMETPREVSSLPVPRYRSSVSSHLEQLGGLMPPPVLTFQRFNLDSYLAIIRKKLDKAKRYPYLARRLNLQGKVGVVFRLGRDGRLIGQVHIRKSSGARILDRAAMDCVRRAAPFPPLPHASRVKELVLSIDIRFQLRGSL